MNSPVLDIVKIAKKVERVAALGFDGYCTDCENVTIISKEGRCSCGSGRVLCYRRAPHTEDR